MAALEIGQHWMVNVNILPPPFNTVHMDTLITAWIAMALVIVFSFIATRKLNIIPNKIQTFAEMILEFIQGIAYGQMEKNEANKHVPLIASLFLFIATANLIGQIPWRLYHLPHGELAAPTNDLNTTLALALIVLVYYIVSGICKKGLGYFKHYFQPFWFMFPFNLLEDITKPVTLSLRLFANILAGEIIVLVFLGLCAVILPIPMMLFEIFVAFIQAFIFAILTATYISMAVNEEH